MGLIKFTWTGRFIGLIGSFVLLGCSSGLHSKSGSDHADKHVAAQLKRIN